MKPSLKPASRNTVADSLHVHPFTGRRQKTGLDPVEWTAIVITVLWIGVAAIAGLGAA